MTSPTHPPTQAPTADELLGDLVVQDALEQAWIDSRADDPLHRHEEGGWIYLDLATGQIKTRRAQGGVQDLLDLSSPPLVAGHVVVGVFHTHPNPASEGCARTPSPGP